MSWLPVGFVALLALYWGLIAWRLWLGNRATATLASWDEQFVSHLTGQTVSVVIAARNEASRLDQSVQRILDQQNVNLELVIVDDRSNDDTGRIAQEAASRDPRVKYVRVDDLPAGWLGKCHACWQGAQRATGNWLLFTDGDIHMSRDVIARAVAVSQLESADHLTLFPDILAERFGVRIAILGQAQLFTLYTSPETINADRSHRWVGIGAFNLIRRETYAVIGGHETLKMEVVDDMKLGYLVRRGGFRQRVYAGMSDVQADWAQSVVGVIRALEKNWFAATEFNLVGSMACFVLIPTTILGAIIAPWITGWAGLPAHICLLLVCAQSWTICRRFKWPVYLAIFTPLGWLIFVASGAWSVFKTLRQGGICWRNSFYSLDELKRGVVR